MKFYFYLIFLGFSGLFLISCSDNSSGSKSSQLSYELLSETLETAYQQDSQQQLDTFFEYWNEMVDPIITGDFNRLSRNEKEAYRLFDKFYSPNDLNRLSHGEHENFESGFRYVVVQNKLQVTVTDTNPRFYYYRGVDLIENSIDDFRPELPDLDFPKVYLTNQADSVIYFYLLNADSTFQEDYIDRAEFLRQAMQLTPHHWINDYHKYTMPHADRVIFNEDFTLALVQFRVFFQFGDAYFEKQNGTWVLTESELTAIE